MDYDCVTITVGDIDMADERFSHRFRIEPCDCHAGCALPPVVVKKKGYRIISGFRRVKALSEKGNATVLQVLVPRGDRDDKELFLLSLELNSEATLSDLDRAVLVRKAVDTFALSQDELVRHLAPLCGVEPSWKMIRRFLELSTLAPVLLEYLFKNRLGLKFASALLKLSADERALVFQALLKHVSFTESEMEQFVDLVQDIMRQRTIGLNEVLLERTITEMLEQRQIPPKEKARTILRALWEMRNPVQATLRARVRQIEKEISRTRSVVFSVPDAFEREHYSLTLDFRSRAELERTLEDLKRKASIFEGIESVTKLR